MRVYAAAETGSVRPFVYWLGVAEYDEAEAPSAVIAPTASVT